MTEKACETGQMPSFFRFSELPPELQMMVWESSWEPRALPIRRTVQLDRKRNITYEFPRALPVRLPSQLHVNRLARKTTLSAYRPLILRLTRRIRKLAGFFNPEIDTLDVHPFYVLIHISYLFESVPIRHVLLRKPSSPEQALVYPDDFVDVLNLLLVSPTIRTFTVVVSDATSPGSHYRFCRKSSLPPSTVTTVAEPPPGHAAGLDNGSIDGSPAGDWRFRPAGSILKNKGMVLFSIHPYLTNDWIVLQIVQPDVPEELIWVMGIHTWYEKLRAKRDGHVHLTDENLRRSGILRKQLQTLHIWNGICLPSFGLQGDSQPPYTAPARLGHTGKWYDGMETVDTALLFFKAQDLAESDFPHVNNGRQEGFMQALKYGAELDEKRGGSTYEACFGKDNYCQATDTCQFFLSNCLGGYLGAGSK